MTLKLFQQIILIALFELIIILYFLNLLLFYIILFVITGQQDYLLKMKKQERLNLILQDRDGGRSASTEDRLQWFPVFCRCMETVPLACNNSLHPCRQHLDKQQCLPTDRLPSFSRTLTVEILRACCEVTRLCVTPLASTCGDVCTRDDHVVT